MAYGEKLALSAALMIYLWFESRISRRRAWKSVQLEQDEISPHIPSWRPGIQAYKQMHNL